MQMQWQMFNMIFLCCNCSNWGIGEILSLINIVVAIFIGVIIPKKIAWEQRYSSLLVEYRSHDFGEAIMEIGLFFHDICKNDVSKIEREYTLIFVNDFYGANKTNDRCTKLHYQRRLLSQFYWDLDQCANSVFIRKKRIQKDFSSKEANLLKILYYLNLAAESPNVFKDLSCDDRLPPKAKSINIYIKDIYNILKDAPPYIR